MILPRKETREWFEATRDLFDQTCELDPEERTGFLKQACEGDADLQREVEDLLQAHDSAAHVLVPPTPSSWSPSEGEAEPARIGRYSIRRRLGSGGMGIVFEARQEDPDRSVALKLIHPAFVSEQHLRRFSQEARALGRLRHPGIAHVYEAGTADTGHGPQPFLAMELVEGERLDHYVRSHRLDSRSILELVAKICDAAHYAHQEGVVHRDLKPGNVLVDRHGQPRILDFGVARLTDAGVDSITRGTSDGEVLGTLAYMSPEQVSADPSAVDPRTDVYALGVVAYELLSGKKPLEIDSASLVAAARMISEEDPPDLGTIHPSFRGDVETIVHRAMDKDKERRYPNAEAMSQDILRFLTNEPIQARPPTSLYRFRKFTQRNPWLIGGAAATLVAILLGLYGTLTFALRESRRAEQATRAQLDATNALRHAETETKKALAFRNLFFSILERGRPELARGAEITIGEALESASERIWEEDFTDGNPEVEGALHFTFGNYYHSLNDFPRAEKHLREAVALQTEALGPGNRETLDSQLMLGWVLNAQNRPDEAIRVFGSIVHYGDTGIDNPEVYIALGDLAYLLRSRGQVEDAIGFGEKAVANLRRLPSTAPEDLMECLFSLSTSFMFFGVINKTLEHAEEAYSIFQTLDPEKQVYHHRIPLQYANALDDNGYHEEAVDIYRRLLDRSLEWPGERGSQTQMILMNMGIALNRMEEYEEALDLLIESYEIAADIRVANYENERAIALRNALDAFIDVDRCEDGLEWSEDLTVNLPDNYNGWSALVTRGVMLEQVERFEEAQKLLQPNFLKLERVLIAGHGLLVESGQSLVRVLDALEEFDEAEELRQRVIRHEELLREKPVPLDPRNPD